MPRSAFAPRGGRPRFKPRWRAPAISFRTTACSGMRRFCCCNGHGVLISWYSKALDRCSVFLRVRRPSPDDAPAAGAAAVESESRPSPSSELTPKVTRSSHVMVQAPGAFLGL